MYKFSVVTNNNNDDNLFEKLAGIEHQRWADWQKYVHNKGTKNEDGSLTISKELVDGWEKQINTPYEGLTKEEKDADREQVKRYWNLIKEKGGI